MGIGGDKPSDPVQQKLPRREIFKLILATYAASLPYLILFLVLMLIAVWFVTTVLFH